MAARTSAFERLVSEAGAVSQSRAKVEHLHGILIASQSSRKWRRMDAHHGQHHDPQP